MIRRWCFQYPRLLSNDCSPWRQSDDTASRQCQVLCSDRATRYAEQRNAIPDAIEQQGRKIWKQQSGYHQRSLSETAMFRLKASVHDKN